MLSGLTRAMRRARTEARGTRAAAALAPGAKLTWRDGADGLGVTAVLPEGADVAKSALEAALAEAGATRVLVVATGPAKPKRSGHDAPLGLPTTAPPTPRTGRPDRARPRGARRVVAVASGKGGVGKSTIAARLALALRAQGQRAGLLDLDVYGPSVPLMFGTDEKPEVRDGAMRPVLACGLPILSIGLLVDDAQALAWRGPMVMGAVKQLTAEADWTGADGRDGPLDWLVIDTPPGTGDAHLSLVQRVILDAAILVTTPSPLALADLARGRQLFARTNVPVLGVVENMAEPGGPFGEGLSEIELAELDLASLAKLPLDPALAALPSVGGDLGLGYLGPVLDALSDPAGDAPGSVDSPGGPG